MTTTPATLIVVDDDPEICELLADYLGRHGYRVFTADGAQALHSLRAEHAPDLLIVRKHSDVPIIMLTASADETDRILGLELGADDYLGKPFNPRELLARVKAVLRRTRSAPPELPAGQARWVSFGNWQLDRMTRELIDLQGERAALSGADFQLLQVFLEHPAKVLTRDDLYALTRGRDAPPLDRSIDVHVCRLRQRLGEDAQHSQLIRTVRGAGYVLTAQVDALT